MIDRLHVLSSSTTLIKSMKKEIFDKYADSVSSLFRITKDELLSKTKRREISEARQILFYLCHERPMRISTIKQFMSELGYSPAHSTIIYSIGAVKKRIEQDNDYKRVIHKIKNSI
jgi:chromosomal replication initiator protein